MDAKRSEIVIMLTIFWFISIIKLYLTQPTSFTALFFLHLLVLFPIPLAGGTHNNKDAYEVLDRCLVAKLV